MSVYNKLFTRILDSSIWLEKSSTRIVWITLIAAMDEDGYAHFAAVENLAARARVTVKEAEDAVACLMAPDPNSSNPANEGRRIERVPGGFMILNAPAHRATLNRVVEREQTRLRVKKHREKAAVTLCNDVTPLHPLRAVTPASESASESASLEGKSAEKGNQSVEAVRPSWEEVKFYADKSGVSEWKAKDWFEEMEGCGWLDHQKRQVVKWQAVFNRMRLKWETDGRPEGPPRRKEHGKPTDGLSYGAADRDRYTYAGQEKREAAAKKDSQ